MRISTSPEFQCNLLVVAKVQVAHEEGNCQRATAAAEANWDWSVSLPPYHSHKHKRTTSTNTTLHSHILHGNFHDHQISVMRASHCSRCFILECAVFSCGGQLWGSANVQAGFGPGDSNSEHCFTMFHQSSPSTLHTALLGDIQPLLPFAVNIMYILHWIIT